MAKYRFFINVIFIWRIDFELPKVFNLLIIVEVKLRKYLKSDEFGGLTAKDDDKTQAQVPFEPPIDRPVLVALPTDEPTDVPTDPTVDTSREATTDLPEIVSSASADPSL